ncbi:MAG: hypothetical protein BGO53_13785 [Sphingobacteriales bacterium 39-19]|nr:MAG: hypothetical protein BGO53_13785 [Sphingobacteriales bacterium 39-19]
MKKTFLLLLLIVCYKTMLAQDKSNRGTEFWLAYGYDYTFYYEPPINSQEMAIYISTELAATVTVSITNTGYNQILNIPANTVNASILIPKSGPNDARTLTDGLQNRGIHIVSDVPVAVYSHVYANQVSGATMLMPVETYGYIYHSINYYQTTSQSSPNEWYSWFYAIASEDNTRLEITPSDTTKNGWLPGQTYIVNLNKGESYHVFGKAIFNGNPADASKDMTGSKIVSVPGADGNCHPVAVFSGSSGIRLCRGDGGEFMQQQVFPQQAWGTRYLTYHTINNAVTNILETNRNYYRVCVADPSTVVKKNGVVMTGLIKGFYYEYMDSTGGDYIEANKPILVSQYMVNKNQCWNYPTSSPVPPSYGDPEMFYISPIEQGQKYVLFYTSRKSTIDYVYANIHLPTAAVPSLRVDGNIVPAAQIIPHPHYPSYSVALVRFPGPPAQHWISSDSAFTSTVYGLGNFESYGYNVGTLINNLNNYSAIQNSLNSNGQTDTFTCPKSPVRLFVKLAYPALSIHWKLSQLSGVTPNADSIINAPVPLYTQLINGRTYYVYSLQQDFIFNNAGTYYLPVSYTAAVIQNCNQTEQATVKIIVKPGPVADFITPSPLCLQDSVRFTGNSISNGFNLTYFTYTFDDNSTIHTRDAVKKFTSPGSKVVSYKIIADNGCLADTAKTIVIQDAPTANFGVDSGICIGDSVYITDTSAMVNGNILQWNWNFGDGTTSVNNNGNPFYHTYTNAGTFTVSLVVQAANGCQSDTIKKIVTVTPKPISKFGFDKNVCLGQAIAFSDSSTYANGAITEWHWDFGNGFTEIRTDALPFNYTYPTAGSFTVSLKTRAAGGCLSNAFSLQVIVANKPAADFTFTGKPCVDSAFQFSSAIAYDANTPKSWYWGFGDGQQTNINTTHTVSHVYNNANTLITVSHAVTVGGCKSDTVTKVIPVINNNPGAVFNINKNIFCENEPVQFSATGSPDISQWIWNFGDGTGNQTPPFNKAYSNAGNYTPVLIVENTGGCRQTVTGTPLSIIASPPIDAGPPIYLQLGGSKTIEASIANANQYNFLWQPNTALSSTTVLNPVTSATQDILYFVTATHKTSGCAATDSVLVKVVTDVYVPTAFTPNNDHKNDEFKVLGSELIEQMDFKIFNRYGQLVFETKDKNRGWNGRLGGVQAPLGAYIYLLTYKKYNASKTVFIKNSFVLLR